jgi:hypothetical protein
MDSKKIVPKEILDPVSRKENEEIIYDNDGDLSSAAENKNDDELNNRIENHSKNNSTGIED